MITHLPQVNALFSNLIPYLRAALGENLSTRCRFDALAWAHKVPALAPVKVKLTGG